MDPGKTQPQGSSPQARGAPVRTVSALRVRGLIPAGAGSTAFPRSSTAFLAAHPRRRGEHWRTLHRSGRSWGSSPQARGAHALHDWPLPDDRLIPAGAGSTRLPVTSPCAAEAHPRRRGEHPPSRSTTWATVGSSPQARGARATGGGPQRGAGLIPAGAGSTDEPSHARRWSRAHPRRRGEHERHEDFVPLLRGSSPQARGAPRAPCTAWTLRTGSSPQARGAPHPAGAGAHGRGLIPAGAGSTSTGGGEQRTCQAHPRRRGEHNPSPWK